MSDIIEYLHEMFAGFGNITTRRMFGAHGIYRFWSATDYILDDRELAAVAKKVNSVILPPLFGNN